MGTIILNRKETKINSFRCSITKRQFFNCPYIIHKSNLPELQGPVLVAQVGYCTVHKCMIYKNVCRCIEWKHSGCLQQYQNLAYEVHGPGLCSQYSDSLRDEQSSDWIPAVATFSTNICTDPESHSASCTMGTGFISRVHIGLGMALTTHPHLAPRLKKE